MTMRHPIFVVGSPRSGTSMMVDILYTVGYHGYREGGFLPVLGAIDRVVDRQYEVYAAVPNPQVLISNIDRDVLKRDVFEILKRAVDEKHSKTPWFDKTGNPDMIATLPLIKSLWPGAGFVFCKRRALENIKSRIVKFPQHTFDFHCRDWAGNMSGWRNVRGALGDSYIEVDQQDMLQRPEELSEALHQFLGLEPATSAILDILKTSRPQQTSVSSAETVYSLASIGWTAHQQEHCQKCCAEEMAAYGYTWDETYRHDQRKVERQA